MLKRKLNTRIEKMIYIIIFLWLVLGVVGNYGKVSYSELSAYFISLTGFVGVYVFGQSKRASKGTAIFMKGRTSGRELMIYIMMFIWFVSGIVSILFKTISLTDAATYLSTLTPFVGAYIIGETFKPEEINKTSKEIDKLLVKTEENENTVDNIDISSLITPQ
jgi:cation transport ATPase